jgi:manganese/zinc/iron transport system substrate-binding protein
MPMSSRRLITGIVGVAVLTLSNGSAALADAPVNVLATIAMIADVAENVADDCATISTLIMGGSDPHLYKATPSDIEALRSADLILYAGFGLEGQLGEVLNRVGEDRATVAVSPASIPLSSLISVQDMYGVDPHLWMDVSLWSMTVPTISEAIAELNPECSDTLAANAAAYQAMLAALHGWVGDSVATIPEGQRRLVTAHDAFGYYGRAYGIEVTAIQGLSTEAEASIADINDVAETVFESGVPAVFIETTINSRTVEAVIEAVGALGGNVSIGGELYSDAMGDAGTLGGSYVGMIHENTVTITEALGGTPAPLPEALHEWAAEWNVRH